MGRKQPSSFRTSCFLIYCAAGSLINASIYLVVILGYLWALRDFRDSFKGVPHALQVDWPLLVLPHHVVSFASLDTSQVMWCSEKKERSRLEF